MSAVKIAMQQNQKSGRKKSSGTMSAEASPDSKCPICLDIFNNISYLDICLHKFCFRCIHEWSKNKAECPLCKQPFNSIYHSIKSEQDFKKFDLRPIDNGSFGTFEGVRFRYRTTLTGVRRQMQGRTSPPPDNGVMFEASSNPPLQRQDRYVRRMMMRLAAKRRAANEGRAVNNVREQEMVNFRRELYRQGVRVRNVRDGGRSRETSAEFYRTNPACLHRLVPWVKRELVVLYGAHGSLVNIVQHIIMSCITRFDMEDRAIQEELRPFLQGRTEHFLHEFVSFAKAPFNMEAYDQHAVYDYPAPSSNEDSSSNSSVIAISEDDEEDPTEQIHSVNSASSLRHSVWDDETPGPSYSTTVEQSRTEAQSVLDSDSDSSIEAVTRDRTVSAQPASPKKQTDLTRGACSKQEVVSPDNDDCVIVGYVKPRAERTPELVHLSSDCEESESEDKTQVHSITQHIRFTSLSPAASQSSDPDVAGQSHVELSHQSHLDSNQNPSSSTSSRHKTLRKSDRKRSFARRERSREKCWSKDGDHRRRAKSRSGGHSSRSPVVSERAYLYSSSRDYTRCDSSYKKKGTDHNYQSFSHYSQERSEHGTHCTERKSYYYRSHKYSDWHSVSRSPSRDSRQRDKRHSSSRTYSSSRSPSARRKSAHDKPGGKRKHKTRHLDEASNSCAEEDSAASEKHKKKNKAKRHRKSKERSVKTSRSVSVEFVNDGEEYERSKRHHKKKKKHKKKSKSHKSERTEKRSPTVITIDSDSDCSATDLKTLDSGFIKESPVNPATDDPVEPVEPSPTH